MIESSFPTVMAPGRSERKTSGLKGPGIADRTKLILGSLAFLLLTIGIFWYQFQRVQAHDAAPEWSGLQWSYLFLMLLLLPMDTVSGGLRIWAVSRVLQRETGFWTCMKAEWANIGVSMLTPSQTGGGFGQVYLLTRGGASVGTALTVSLISFLGTVIGLMCLGVYFGCFGDIPLKGPLFQGAVWTFTLICGSMVVGALWPGLFRVVIVGISRSFCRLYGEKKSVQTWWEPRDAGRGLSLVPEQNTSQDRMGPLAAKLVNLIYCYHNDARRFLREGKGSFACVLLLSFAFMVSRCITAFLCIRFLGIQNSTLWEVMEVQLALIFLIYFAPTPGASGLAEGVSLTMMAPVVPNGFAPYYNLLWRSTTLYLPAAAGLLCLSCAVLRDTRKLWGGSRRS
jgi:uncharacterized membrane protein YbhN (UPF0104 family)